MELYIKLIDGVPVDHPILGDNFRQVFPNIDTDNLPPEFAKFIRVAPPVIGIYEVYEGVTYERIGDIYTDVHHVRPMTADEKLEKQNEVKADWAIRVGWASWIFDEQGCGFVPPIPYPTDGNFYQWDEATCQWVAPTANSI